MAKNKPADNQLTVGEKYLARIIAARWSSLPTVGKNEAGLAIQIKLSVLCTAPLNQYSSLLWIGGCVYFIPPTIVPSNPQKIKVQFYSSRFFSMILGLLSHLYPNHNSKLEHNGAGIICEFGPTDPINGYQSILLWEPVTNDEFAGLIATAIKTGSKPQIHINGLDFPMDHVVTRNGKEVYILSLQEWHALKLLAENQRYNGEDLVKHAWTKAGKTPPEEVKSTMYTLISKLKDYIERLKLYIHNDRNGKYSLRTYKSKTSRRRSQSSSGTCSNCLISEGTRLTELHLTVVVVRSDRDHDRRAVSDGTVSHKPQYRWA